MFAVPGWDIRAESLVAEKPSAKAGKGKADAHFHLPNKRKRSQLESEHVHSLDASELEKRWNQRFGGEDASQDLYKDGLPVASERKADLGPVRSNTRAPTVTSSANSGHQKSTPSPHGPEDKLSRKQKKLRNKRQREQASENTASDVTAPKEEHHGGPSAKSKEARKPDKSKSFKNHALQDTHGPQGTSPSEEFHASGMPQANAIRKGESLLHDPTPSHFSSHADSRPSPSPSQQGRSGAGARTSTPPPLGLTAVTATRTKTSKPSTSTASSTTKLTPLQSKFAAKLTSARFRHLNQQLYTAPSTDSLELFKTQPSLFTEYHQGFTQQTQSWPVNPVNTFIAALQKRHDLPRRKTGSCTIADLGCGDAPLARALAKGKAGKKLGLKIHSFDLHAVNEHVTVADIASLPLRDGEADIAIFCLALMGTNWLDFVEECWRVLRGDGKGEVWVAEVKSRFVSRPGRRAPGQAVENSVGKKRRRITQKSNDDEIDVDDAALLSSGNNNDGDVDTNAFSAFISVFQRRGFKLKEGSIDSSNKMFVSMTFYKSGVPVAGKHRGLKWNGKEYQSQKQQLHDDDEVDPKEEAAVLKACVYKTR